MQRLKLSALPNISKATYQQLLEHDIAIDNFLFRNIVETNK